MKQDNRVNTEIVTEESLVREHREQAQRDRQRMLRLLNIIVWILLLILCLGIIALGLYFATR